MAFLDTSFPHLKWILDQCDLLETAVLIVSDYQSGTVQYISPSVQKIFGYSQEYFLESGYGGLYAHCHSEDLASGKRELAYYTSQMMEGNFSAQNKIYSSTFEMRFRHGDGNWIWMKADAYILQFNDLHKPQYLLSLFSDFTKRRMAEQYLWDELTRRVGDAEELNKIQGIYNQLKDPVSELPIPLNWVETSLRTLPIHILSEREKEVLKLIAQGYTSKTIAEKLHITEHTAETHRKNMIEKFGVKNTAELVNEVNKSYWLG